MVIEYFKQICDVPRGSGYNTKISNFLVEFAKSRNLRYIQDEYENVIIFKPGSKGFEDVPPLIFQGHMDMVCEKVNDSIHDFENEGIKYIFEDGFIRADGTTLGADDGIALAYMLELLADDKLVCPPLEMVFTTDEETGMDGAINLDTSVLKGRCMINLDSEEEKGFVVACAGGRKTTTRIPVSRETVRGIELTVEISGLKGGHSGTEIDKNRSNAVLLLGRLLAYLPNDMFYLLDIGGGYKDNVIPNEAYVRLVAAPDKIEELVGICGDAAVIISDELIISEPDLEISITEDDANRIFDYEVLDADSYAKVFYYLTYVPNGVQVMSASIPGMVESSLNLGVFRIEDDYVKGVVSLRSQKESYKDYMTKKLEGIASMIEAEFIVSGEYPGYDMTSESEFRDVMCDAYEEVFKRKPVIAAIHAGLEIGVLSEKIPGLDVISIGPDTFDIHTVEEKVEIASIERVEAFIRKAIEKYCSIFGQNA